MQTVLIVGAGPVGLTLAGELARYGVPVRIVDRSPEPTRTSKALAVWSRTLELMDRMGCTASFLDAGLRVHGATFSDGTRIIGHAGFGGIRRPLPVRPHDPPVRDGAAARGPPRRLQGRGRASRRAHRLRRDPRRRRGGWRAEGAPGA